MSENKPNKARQAFPTTETENYLPAEGLTKREMLAAMAMQGILSSLPSEAPYNAETCAAQAIAHADALLGKL